MYIHIQSSTFHISQNVETIQMFTSRRKDKKCSTSAHTTEDHSAMKRHEVFVLATAWVDFENSMLSEKSQAQKATHYTISFTRDV